MTNRNSKTSMKEKINELSNTVSMLEKKLDRIMKFVESAEVDRKMNGNYLMTERPSNRRAQTEHFPEQTDQTEQTLRISRLSNVRGRHREILAMLINNGFHTYKQIAHKLNISESRARAYISDLRNTYNVPLKQIRDPEGYKIGIDVRFVEQILASK